MTQHVITVCSEKIKTIFGINFKHLVTGNFILGDTTKKQLEISQILQKSSIKQSNLQCKEIELKKWKINHYIKIRKLFYLPLRGQRTHTNARTCKNKNMQRKGRQYKKR